MWQWGTWMNSKNKLIIRTNDTNVLTDRQSSEMVLPMIPEVKGGDLSEADEQMFLQVISTELSDAQIARVTEPASVYRRKKNVLALHWHPEFVPMNLIRERIDRTFPLKSDELVIPTQHNELLSYDGVYSGVEIDCFSKGFNQKVQLLLHLTRERADNAQVLKSMAAYTSRYRSSQLYDFINSFIGEDKSRLNSAAMEVGANEQLLGFVVGTVSKINQLLDKHQDKIPAIMIKNKLLRNYFDAMRGDVADIIIERAQSLLSAVKKRVKENFPLTFFYRTEEVIEEARAQGAGIIIPHPEQFWPILLADYDVDGIEIWNPQSRKYTEFLISVINSKNSSVKNRDNRLLIFMGDDTHMGEKVKDPLSWNAEKASREIGVQPGWDDLFIRKKLIKAGMEISDVMAEYRQRLT